MQKNVLCHERSKEVELCKENKLCVFEIASKSIWKRLKQMEVRSSSSSSSCRTISLPANKNEYTYINNI